MRVRVRGLGLGLPLLSRSSEVIRVDSVARSWEIWEIYGRCGEIQGRCRVTSVALQLEAEGGEPNPNPNRNRNRNPNPNPKPKPNPYPNPTPTPKPKPNPSPDTVRSSSRLRKASAILRFCAVIAPTRCLPWGEG